MNLSQTATGRSDSLFSEDITKEGRAIKDCVTGARILAVGAAGSIGSHTVKLLAQYNPSALHIIDQNENALAELVRQFRSGTSRLDVEDFQTLPLDYGSAITRSFLHANAPYDRILNFAAIKHVRSEKDPFSIGQMLDTNIIKQAKFRKWISETSPSADYFSVSTDKAANPVSFMGATKRIMEHVLFQGARESGMTGKITTARFANVAYSNGSLLQSFENRLARREPIACPEGIKRFFVSLEESGEICTLASIALDHEHIAIPRLNPADNLVLLRDTAERFLSFNNLKPSFYTDEDAALHAVEAEFQKGCWPVLMTPANTAGEKPYEEFVGKNESTVEINLKQILAIPYHALHDTPKLDQVVDTLEQMIMNPSGIYEKEHFKEIISELEPNFRNSHIESTLNLDQRI